MQPFLSKFKEIVLNMAGFVLFHSRVLKLINLFINNFQLRKNESSKIAFPYIKKRRSKNVQILGYHRVNDDYDPFFPATPTEVFSKQMDYLTSMFNIFSLEDTVEQMKRKDIPDNSVVVTFDDGYMDNYSNAFPILKRLQIPATVFLVTEAIGTARVLWHDRVFSAFRKTRLSFLEGYGENSSRYPLRTVEEKLIAHKKVLKLLCSLDEKQRSMWIEHLMQKLQVADQEEVPNLMLTWEEVRSMHENGISFGSHTVSHPILSNISVERIREEVSESKTTIEEKLGSPVKTFAYPHGKRSDFNEVSKNILKEVGYICAATTIFGANENKQDLYELRRGIPGESYLPNFAVKLNWHKFCT